MATLTTLHRLRMTYGRRSSQERSKVHRKHLHLSRLQRVLTTILSVAKTTMNTDTVVLATHASLSMIEAITKVVTNSTKSTSKLSSKSSLNFSERQEKVRRMAMMGSIVEKKAIMKQLEQMIQTKVDFQLTALSVMGHLTIQQSLSVSTTFAIAVPFRTMVKTRTASSVGRQQMVYSMQQGISLSILRAL